MCELTTTDTKHANRYNKKSIVDNATQTDLVMKMNQQIQHDC